MLKHHRLTAQFVQYIPQQLAPGVLYIASEFGTATHSCCCGCGREIVTPLGPTDWKIAFDGKTVSMSPSVGNWNLPCRSHYIIHRNRVIECAAWTPQEVKLEQVRSQQVRDRFFNQQGEAQQPSTATQPTPKQSMLSRIINYLTNILK